MASSRPNPVRRVCCQLSCNTPLEVETISLAQGLFEEPPIRILLLN